MWEISQTWYAILLPSKKDDQIDHQVSPQWNWAMQRECSVNVNVPSECSEAIKKSLKSGKAPGPDKAHPEFLKKLRLKLIKWLSQFFTACTKFCHLRKGQYSGYLKTRKKHQWSKKLYYGPISLLCVPFKVLERIILLRIKPYTESCLPESQARFRLGRSTVVDQVLNLTSSIESNFQ